VFLYEYDSTIIYKKDRSSFIDKANQLMETLRAVRHSTSRPLIFVGHSMGGLLIKQALILAHSNARYTPIKEATASIAFFATPHKGGSKKRVKLGRVVERFAGVVRLHNGDELMEVLVDKGLFSDTMHELWRQQASKYAIVSFWGDSDVVRCLVLFSNSTNICRASPERVHRLDWRVIKKPS
jgi:uncharacterized alpha/beta hydrolase family protein